MYEMPVWLEVAVSGDKWVPSVYYLNISLIPGF